MRTEAPAHCRNKLIHTNGAANARCTTPDVLLLIVMILVTSGAAPRPFRSRACAHCVLSLHVGHWLTGASEQRYCDLRPRV